MLVKRTVLNQACVRKARTATAKLQIADNTVATHVWITMMYPEMETTKKALPNQMIPSISQHHEVLNSVTEDMIDLQLRIPIFM